MTVITAFDREYSTDLDCKEVKKSLGVNPHRSTLLQASTHFAGSGSLFYIHLPHFHAPDLCRSILRNNRLLLKGVNVSLLFMVEQVKHSKEDRKQEIYP